MKFIVERSSGRRPSTHNKAVYNKYGNRWEIEIDNLEELLALDERIIINPAESEDELPTIEFYDDYRE